MNNFHEKEIAKLSSHVHEVLGDRLNTFYLQRFVALDKYLTGLLKNHDGCGDSISDAEIEGAFEIVWLLSLIWTYSHKNEISLRPYFQDHASSGSITAPLSGYLSIIGENPHNAQTLKRIISLSHIPNRCVVPST